MTTLRRRWFRFSLRTLFALVTLAAVACWVGYRLNWIRQRHARLATLGFSPDDLEVFGEVAAPSQLSIFGERGWEMLPLARHTSRRELRELHSLFPEAQITACGVRESPDDSPGDSPDEWSFVRVLPGK